VSSPQQEEFMPVAVFLKGINVGGHRRLRPSVLAKELERFDIVSLGAAGTFVVRKAVERSKLCAAIVGRVPFEVDVMICSENEIHRLIAGKPFDCIDQERDIISFVGVTATRQQPWTKGPLRLPSSGAWGLKVLKCQDRFVVGLYRRHMKVLSCFSQLERICGGPLAIRNWNTILAVNRALQA
jgi:uncharacterized protein (DUF1697 family)